METIISSVPSIDLAQDFPILDIEGDNNSPTKAEILVKPSISVDQLKELLNVIEEILHYRTTQQKNLEQFDLETNLRNFIEKLLEPTTKRVEESRHKIFEHNNHIFRLDEAQNEITFSMIEL